MYICPLVRAAQALSPHLPVYTYHFTHTSECTLRRQLGLRGAAARASAALLGSTHMAELPFVFMETSVMDNGGCSYGAGEQQLGAVMSGVAGSGGLRGVGYQCINLQ